MKRLAIVLGLGLALTSFIFAKLLGANNDLAATLAIVILCATWWASEAIPIPMTACIPLALFPLLGIISRAELGASLGNPINLLLIGGFILSVAMVKSKAHLLITLRLFAWLKPSNESQVIISFMLCSAFLSMWISNAAAAMMLIPAALASIEKSRSPQFTLVLLLGICYAASVGGLATPIGTPPNLVFIQAYENTTGKAISFIEWMKWGLPATCVLLPIVMFYLLRKVKSTTPSSSLYQAFEHERSGNETRVLLIFGLVVLAWMTRADPLGGGVLG